MSLITASSLGLSHGAEVILRDVDFAISSGEIVTLVGPNGSGKSTLVRLLLGILSPTAGRVRRRPGLRIGYVPQKLSIDASLPLTVARFLALPDRHAPAAISQELENVGIPGLEQRQLTALSGGQFQRALLARALLTAPDILVLDEPTQGLDQQGEAAFYRLIDEVRARTGAAVLLVSHDLHVVMSASDRVICLNGHVCCEGTPHLVADAPEYRALFGHGTQGALALYPHDHDHCHDHSHGEGCDHA
ncbi:metal ABC transporter ATP-binding protein [Aliiroseovarius subalbicans]|uniref:ATP-binding cassette domain-containing protein n=1 Tax=Aliiroseovarius subalbicans TaxID=2925840 RepID=UPI001F571416|nr:metal ABC transporter ATP-binding protein [Aliiroseovarius subalbicans]MCI2397817.1 metal ABC transporter ATP-binding protein [Aliiroseovarius subalbicans]